MGLASDHPPRRLTAAPHSDAPAGLVAEHPGPIRYVATHVVGYGASGRSGDFCAIEIRHMRHYCRFLGPRPQSGTRLVNNADGAALSPGEQAAVERALVEALTDKL